MREHANIEALVTLQPDYIGFIFYPKSPRYAGNILKSHTTKNIPATIKKTGVFVNADNKTITDTAKIHNLNAVQLHGEESPEQCRQLQAEGLEVIKAFKLTQASDLQATNAYHASCHFFLFDTPTRHYGGSGKKFDWSVLSHYKGNKPFFLSGGIGEEDINAIIEKCPLKPYAVDINSRFETEPGLKDIQSIQRFLASIKKFNF